MVCSNERCEAGRRPQRWLSTPGTLEQDRLRHPCTHCGERLARRPQGPGTSVVQRLDNGVMPRAVERPENMEELLEEESRARAGGARG